MENCENLKKMSFKGLEKRARIFSPYVVIFTNDQVEEMKNRISKHRGLFKPPLTPERFWDPDIIEDSAEDPRSKIIHDASPLRKHREEKAFEVGELVNGDEFE